MIRPIGDLDIRTVARFASATREVADAGFERVIIDLRELTFMDSAGLRALLEMQSAIAAGSALQIIRASEPVQRIFHVTGLAERLPFVSAAEALR